MNGNNYVWLNNEALLACDRLFLCRGVLYIGRVEKVNSHNSIEHNVADVVGTAELLHRAVERYLEIHAVNVLMPNNEYVCTLL